MHHPYLFLNAVMGISGATSVEACQQTALLSVHCLQDYDSHV